MARAAVPGATELLPPPTSGRRFVADRVVRLGDVDPAGSLRLDATARYLQDVATDDATDAALDGRFGWLVRRTLIDVARPALLGESLSLTTWCTGAGPSWAERRTAIAGAAGAAVDAVSVWVQVDGTTGRPTRLTGQFTDIYGEACAGRSVSARLSLGGPPGGAARRRWLVRRTDLDQFNHVNNAANWAFLEESVDSFGDRRGVAEMEFVAPVEPDADVGIRIDAASSACSAWLVCDDAVLSAARWTSR
ncbi:MAG: hypothetical protein HKN44_14670 [Ilumatobacter sp.]|nr:hypothetical protein [Ilumatobacter sp.]